MKNDKEIQFTDGTIVEESDNEIQFGDDTVILENDIARVELVNFYQEEYNGTIEKYITLKVTNKCEREFLFDLGRIYIGDEAVRWWAQDGNWGPIPGKSGCYSYEIVHEDADDTPIDSMDLLFELEGIIELAVYDEARESIEDNVEEYFSIKNINFNK